MENINILKINLNGAASEVDMKGAAAASHNASFNDDDTASCSSSSPRSGEKLTQRQIDLRRLEELLLSDGNILTEEDYREWQEIRQRRKAEEQAW